VSCGGVLYCASKARRFGGVPFFLHPICACSQRLWHWLYTYKISLKTLIRPIIDRKCTIKQLLMVGTKRLGDVRNL
jgi:hypothetical protein